MKSQDFPPPSVGNATHAEKIPMHPDLKQIIEKILEQNSAILAQNAKILEVLGKPIYLNYVIGGLSDDRH